MRLALANFWRTIGVALLGIAAALPSRAETVVVLLSDQKGNYAEFAEALAASLRRTMPATRVRHTVVPDEALGADVRLVVAVGSAAQQGIAARQARPPVLAVLTPRLVYERLFERVGRATALYLDHPEERQLGLLTLLPAPPTSVGFVASPLSALSAPRLRAAAQRLRIRLVEVPVNADRDVARAVQEAAAQSEIVLAHPDPSVFSPLTIQSILLTTYRAKVPLFGFSPAYTRAGALLSLHTSPAQLAEQAAEMARQFWLGGVLPAAQYPRDYEVSVNRQVARSLGIEVPAETILVERLRQKERGQ